MVRTMSLWTHYTTMSILLCHLPVSPFEVALFVADLGRSLLQRSGSLLLRLFSALLLVEGVGELTQLLGESSKFLRVPPLAVAFEHLDEPRAKLLRRLALGLLRSLLPRL